MYHHATYRGEELIVLGHDPRRNDCMLVKLSGLPMNEQSELRKIAASRTAQASNYLIPILRRVESPLGSDWFSFLCKKMEQRNSAVFTLPIKEIQDSLDPDQKAIFKGYGKGRKNQTLEIDDLERAQTGGLDEPVDDLPVRAPGPQVQRPDTGSNLDYKLDLLIETVADENRQTQQLLGKLLTVMTEKNAPARPPRKSRETKTTRPRSDGRLDKPITTEVEAQ
jgi:hypothetical protein